MKNAETKQHRQRPQNKAAVSRLEALHLVFPHYANSFYTKGKVTKRTLPKVKETLVIDCIRQCSFGCAFCFAGQTRKRGDWIPSAKLVSLLRDAQGIEKIVLIGGEPFEHPEITQIIQEALHSATSEVEVFTNGQAIPDSLEAARDWVLKLIGKEKEATLVLTLAADAWHKKRHGEKRFKALVETLLALEGEGVFKPRFNVTDARIKTDDYLDWPTMKETMETLSDALAKRFKRSVFEMNIEAQFYLNPLIAIGAQEKTAETEFLRSVDFLFNPEIVITQRAESLLVVSALNAAWMPTPPMALTFGRLEEASLADIILNEIAGRRLCFKAYPILKTLFLALAEELRVDAVKSKLAQADALQREAARRTKILTHLEEGEKQKAAEALFALYAFFELRRFEANPDDYFERLANEALWIVGFGEQRGVFELTGRADFDKLGLPVYRKIVALVVDRFGEAAAFESAFRFLFQFALDDEPEAKIPLFRQSEPSAQNAEVETEILLPFEKIAMATGFSAWPKEQAFLTRPRLFIAQGHHFELRFSNVEAGRLAMNADETQRLEALRLLSAFYAAVFADVLPRFQAAFLEKLEPTGDTGFVEAFQAGCEMAKIADEAFYGRSLQRLFEYLTFDPAANKAPYDNLTLLRLLIDLGVFSGYEEKERKRFFQTLHFWLEYHENQ